MTPRFSVVAIVLASVVLGRYTGAQDATELGVQRGTEIMAPSATSVVPTTFETRIGAKKELAVGAFTFDFVVFAPKTDITMVMVGRAGNVEWTLTSDELAHMR